ncbi:hypothetical protein LFREDSHE_21870 [Shewanella baltica]
MDVQESDADSMLNGYRRFLAWRKLHPVLVEGDIQFVDTNEPILAFIRTLGELKIFVGFNLGDTNVELDLSQLELGEILTGHGLKTAQIENNQLKFSAFASFYAVLN